MASNYETTTRPESDVHFGIHPLELANRRLMWSHVVAAQSEVA